MISSVSLHNCALDVVVFWPCVIYRASVISVFARFFYLAPFSILLVLNSGVVDITRPRDEHVAHKMPSSWNVSFGSELMILPGLMRISPNTVSSLFSEWSSIFP